MGEAIRPRFRSAPPAGKTGVRLNRSGRIALVPNAPGSLRAQLAGASAGATAKGEGQP